MHVVAGVLRWAVSLCAGLSPFPRPAPYPPTMMGLSFGGLGKGKVFYAFQHGMQNTHKWHLHSSSHTCHCGFQMSAFCWCSKGLDYGVDRNACGIVLHGGYIM